MKNFLKKIKDSQSTVKKSHIPFRLNFLFFVVFALFVALIIQLAYLQIVNKDFFEARIQSGQINIVEGQAPRGMIYDAKGTVLVSNKANQAILYTKSKTATASEILEVSHKIAGIISVQPDKLTERDKKDFWLADEKNLEEVKTRLTAKEKAEKMSTSEEYSLYVSKVTEAEINFDQSTLAVASIFTRINGAYALQPIFIKNENVTKEEIAVVGEHMADIPGLSTGFDWEREYPQGDSLRSILGTVTSAKQGIPEESLETYLSKGYAMNDRVGRSYLEQQYESVLRGTKSRSTVSLNKNNEIESQEQVYEGEKGKNLMLTIDLDFQKAVEEIVKSSYQGLISSGKAEHSEGAYAVAMNPETGEVLAMVGIEQDSETGELKDDVLGTINKAFVPGSSIKGATVMAGYENNILQNNDVFVDEPLYFQGGTVKSSLFNAPAYARAVALNPVEALTVSSNVYMMKIVLSMMGVEYKQNLVLPDRSDLFETLRKTYRDYGLGTQTGIDLPGEATGYSPTTHYDENGLIPGRMGHLLDLSFGNFDTYTPMQMAQYVSTIANGGKRIAPRIVKGVYGNDNSGELGNVEELFAPKVLNEVAEKEYLEVVQEGFYNVVNGTDVRRTGAGLQGAAYTISAKTGTAETAVGDVELINSTMVAYNTDDHPEIAVAVMLPHLKDDSGGYNVAITKQIFNAYYNFSH